MKLDVVVHAGVIGSLGSLSSNPTHLIYDSMTLAGGTRIKAFAIPEAMNEILVSAKDRGATMDLYVFSKLPAAKQRGLVALGEHGGELFTVEVPPVPLIGRIASPFLFVFGVATIPVLGLGLLILAAWWQVRKLFGPWSAIRPYVQSLPKVTVLGD